MIFAIYARKSTEQERGESGDSLSVEEQIAGAKAFGIAHGWTLGPIFKDEAVSGWTVPLEERPGGKALLDAVRAKKINVLVLRNGSRLARDQDDAAYSLKVMRRAGVRVFYFQTGQEVKRGTALEKFVNTAENYPYEAYAEQVSKDTRAGKLKLARAGRWQGPRVYGYEKREVLGTKGVDLGTVPAEAKSVRNVFDLIAKGHGLLRIAKRLDAEHVPSPRGKGWAVTTLRHMLDNVLYKGTLHYEGRKDDGTVEVVEVSKPEWRIVDDAAWDAAHARLARTRRTHSGHRKADGTLHGRPESGVVSHHLLAGHLRCGGCGGGMYPAVRARNGKVTMYYLCTNYHKQGTKKCSNRYSVPYDTVTAAILSHFKPESLRAAVQAALMAQLYREPLEPSPEDQRAVIEERMRKRTQEIGHLVDGIAASGPVPALVARLKEAQAQHEADAGELEALAGSTLDFDITDEEAMEEWQAMQLEAAQEALAPLDADPATARMVLRDLLVEPITVSPVLDERGRAIAWDYVGLASLDRVLAGRIKAGANARLRGVTPTSHNPQLSCTSRG